MWVAHVSSLLMLALLSRCRPVYNAFGQAITSELGRSSGAVGLAAVAVCEHCSPAPTLPCCVNTDLFFLFWVLELDVILCGRLAVGLVLLTLARVARRLFSSAASLLASGAPPFSLSRLRAHLVSSLLPPTSLHNDIE